LTDEQLLAYFEAGAKRKSAEAFAHLERTVAGTNWGVAMAFDRKGKVARRWESFRRKQRRQTGREKGLSGAQLHAAVMALAAADSSLVKIETRA
jgi:hypothetical protein